MLEHAWSHLLDTYQPTEPDASNEADSTVPRTLAARLAAAMREPGGLRGSCQELAESFATPSQKSNVVRALELIRRTYGDRYVEELRWDRRNLLTPVRRLLKEPPGGGSSADLYSSRSGSRSGRLSSKANSDHRARAPARQRSASSKNFPSPRPRVRARPFPAAPPLLRGRPPAGESSSGGDGVTLDPSPELRARLLERHGGPALAMVLAELRHPRCSAPLDDVDRALRTLAERRTDVPLRLFRDLLARARTGDLLCDARADAARVREAEAAARESYAYRPDDLPLPTPAELHAAEYGRAVYGQLVDVGGGARAVVQPPRPPPRRSLLDELDARLDELDLDALDRDRRARVTPAAAPDDGPDPDEQPDS